MKRLRLFAVHVLVLSALSLQAGQKPDYQTGKLVDLRRYSTGSGAARAQGSFCLAVEVGDMSYLVEHEPYWRGSYEPTDLVVGDSIEVKITGNHMYIKKPKGGDMKTSITRRERGTPDKKPITCALPAAMQN